MHFFQMMIWRLCFACTLIVSHRFCISFFFFFNDPATPEISTLSLHDALPICPDASPELTDKDWEAYVTAHSSRHQAADVERRRSVSQPVVAAWKERHAKVREWLQAKAAPPLDRKSTRLNSSH